MTTHLDKQAETWNLRARDFYARSHTSERRAQMDTFWQRVRDWGLVAPGDCAIDVGCGTGDYLLRLAREGITGVGTDISEDMLRFAAEQDTYGLRWVTTPWNREVIEAQAWTHAFDFAYSVFSPAMDGGGVSLLDRVTKRSGLLIGFFKRDDSLYAQIEKAFRGAAAIAKDIRWKHTMESFEDELRALGRHPICEIYPQHYTQTLSIAAYADFYAKRIYLHRDCDLGELTREITEYLCALAGTKNPQDTIDSVQEHEIAWVRWTK